MSSKILITGSNGLVGKAIRSSLLKQNYSVIATGLGKDRYSMLGGVYEEMDISSLVSCEIIINKYRPDVIVNTAALTNVDECEENKKSCISINTNSILNFIPFVEKYDIHFIQFSSDFVFNGERGRYNENDHCNPVNYYGSSKLETELLLSNRLSNFTILRTSLVYSNDLFRSNFLYWVKSSLEKNIELQIVNDQFRTPTFVVDLEQAIIKVINMKKYGIYHISGGERLSIYQIAHTIAKHYKYNLNLINKIASKTLHQAARRPKDSSLLIDKAINDIDFQPTSLLQSLKLLS